MSQDNPTKGITQEEYVKLRDTFDIIFMDMSITDLAYALDKIHEVIKRTKFLKEFELHCSEYFPKYPKRMSKWYSHAIINQLKSDLERADKTFEILNKFFGENIADQISLHTFPYINKEVLSSYINNVFDRDRLFSSKDENFFINMPISSKTPTIYLTPLSLTLMKGNCT